MKQDEVLQTLREVIAEAENFTTWTVSTPHLVELVKRAVEAEREACAKLAQNRMLADENKNKRIGHHHACKSIAIDIRARGQA
jgi:sugar-specific transcriptional regulator TrmB